MKGIGEPCLGDPSTAASMDMVMKIARHCEAAVANLQRLLAEGEITAREGDTSVTVNIREISANGMTFRCREAGNSGEPVLLLHGFPETSHMWVGFMERLSASGYRCLAPDQRGYSPGARPEGIEHYRYLDIASDALAIADAWGVERFHLVGHDWGATCGWAVLALHPERVLSWTALSIPHQAAFGRAIRDDPDQQTRSQYVTFFQQPGVAESLLTANDFDGLKRIWAMISQDGIAEYLSVFSQPGAVTGAINWYRGSRGFDPEDPDLEFGPVATSTLMIWGNRDAYIGRVAIEAAAAYMAGPYEFVELDAGHWLVQEQPEVIEQRLLAHLERNRQR